MNQLVLVHFWIYSIIISFKVYLKINNQIVEEKHCVQFLIVFQIVRELCTSKKVYNFNNHGLKTIFK